MCASGFGSASASPSLEGGRWLDGSWPGVCLHDGLAVLMNAWPFSSRIGRVAGRLPQELADDVVGSVLDCFRYVQGGGGEGRGRCTSGGKWWLFSPTFCIFFN